MTGGNSDELIKVRIEAEMDFGDSRQQLKEASAEIRGMKEEMADMPNISRMFNSSLEKTASIIDSVGGKVDTLSQGKFDDSEKKNRFIQGGNEAIKDANVMHGLQIGSSAYGIQIAREWFKDLPQAVQHEFDAITPRITAILRSRMSSLTRDGIHFEGSNITALTTEMFKDAGIMKVVGQSVKHANDDQVKKYFSYLIPNVVSHNRLNPWHEARYGSVMSSTSDAMIQGKPETLFPASYVSSFKDAHGYRKTDFSETEGKKVLSKESFAALEQAFAENPIAVRAAIASGISRRNDRGILETRRDLTRADWEGMREALYLELENRATGAGKSKIDFYGQDPKTQRDLARRLTSSSAGMAMLAMRATEAMSSPDAWVEKTNETGYVKQVHEARRVLDRYATLKYSPFVSHGDWNKNPYAQENAQFVMIPESQSTKLVSGGKWRNNQDISDTVALISLAGYNPDDKAQFDIVRDIYANGKTINGVQMVAAGTHGNGNDTVIRMISKEARDRVEQQEQEWAKENGFSGSFFQNFTDVQRSEMAAYDAKHPNAEKPLLSVKTLGKQYDAENKSWSPSADMGLNLEGKRFAVVDISGEGDGSAWVSRSIMPYSNQGRFAIAGKGSVFTYDAENNREFAERAGFLDSQGRWMAKGLNGEMYDISGYDGIIPADVIKNLNAYGHVDQSTGEFVYGKKRTTAQGGEIFDESNEAISEMVTAAIQRYGFRAIADYENEGTNSNRLGAQMTSFMKISPEMREHQAEMYAQRMAELDTEEGQLRYVFTNPEEDWVAAQVHANRQLLSSPTARNRVDAYRNSLQQSVAAGQYIDFGQDDTKISDIRLADNPLRALLAETADESTKSQVLNKMRTAMSDAYDERIRTLIELDSSKDSYADKLKRAEATVSQERKRDYTDQELLDLINLTKDKNGEERVIDFTHMNEGHVGVLRSPTGYGNMVYAKNVASEIAPIFDKFGMDKTGAFVSKDALETLQSADYDGDRAKIVTGNLADAVKKTREIVDEQTKLIEHANTDIKTQEVKYDAELTDDATQRALAAGRNVQEVQLMGGSSGGIRGMQVDLSNPSNNPYLIAQQKMQKMYDKNSVLHKNPEEVLLDGEREYWDTLKLGREFTKFTDKANTVFQFDADQLDKDNKVKKDAEDVYWALKDPNDPHSQGIAVNMRRLKDLQLDQTNLPSINMDAHLMGVGQTRGIYLAGGSDTTSWDAIAEALEHLEFAEGAGEKTKALMSKYRQMFPQFGSGERGSISRKETEELQSMTADAKAEIAEQAKAAYRQGFGVYVDSQTGNEYKSKKDYLEAQYKKYGINMVENATEKFGFTEQRIEDRLGANTAKALSNDPTIASMNEAVAESIQEQAKKTAKATAEAIEEEAKASKGKSSSKNTGKSRSRKKKTEPVVTEEPPEQEVICPICGTPYPASLGECPNAANHPTKQTAKQAKKDQAQLSKINGTEVDLYKTLEENFGKILTDFAGIESTKSLAEKMMEDFDYTIKGHRKVANQDKEQTAADKYFNIETWRRGKAHKDFAWADEHFDKSLWHEGSAMRDAAQEKLDMIDAGYIGATRQWAESNSSNIVENMRKAVMGVGDEFDKQQAQVEAYANSIKELESTLENFQKSREMLAKEASDNKTLIPDSVSEKDAATLEKMNQDLKEARSLEQQGIQNIKTKNNQSFLDRADNLYDLMYGKTASPLEKIDQQVSKYQDDISTELARLETAKEKDKIKEEDYVARKAQLEDLQKYADGDFKNDLYDRLFDQQSKQTDLWTTRSDRMTRQHRARRGSGVIEQHILQNQNEYDQREMMQNTMQKRMDELLTARDGRINPKTGERSGGMKQNSDEYKRATEEINKLSRAMEENKSAMSGLKGPAGAISAGFDSILKGVSNLAKRFGRQLFHKAITEAKKFVIDFDKSMTSIQMITLKTDSQMSTLGDGLISKAKELKMSISEITKSAETLYRQGLTDEEVNERLDVISKFSKVSGTKVDAATKLITVAMNTGLVNDPQVAADVVTALGDNAATNASEIEKGIEKAGAAAAADGTTFGQLAAMLTAITSTTQIGGSTAGRTLNTIFGRMNKIGTNELIYDENGNAISGSAVAKLLKAQDIDMYDKSGNKKSSFDTLYELSQKWESMSDAEQQQIANAIAGTRQYSNFSAIMQGMSEGKISEYMDLVGESSGITDKKYEVYVKSLEASLTNLNNTYDKLVSNLVDNGAATGVIDTLSAMVEGVDNLTGSIGPLGAALTTVLPLLAGVAAMKVGLQTGSWKIAAAGLAVTAVGGIVAGVAGNQIQTETAQERYARITTAKNEAYNNYVSDINRAKSLQAIGSNRTEAQNNEYKTLLANIAQTAGINFTDLSSAAKNAASGVESLSESATMLGNAAKGAVPNIEDYANYIISEADKAADNKKAVNFYESLSNFGSDVASVYSEADKTWSSETIGIHQLSPLFNFNQETGEVTVNPNAHSNLTGSINDFNSVKSYRFGNSQRQKLFDESFANIMAEALSVSSEGVPEEYVNRSSDWWLQYISKSFASPEDLPDALLQTVAQYYNQQTFRQPRGETSKKQAVDEINNLLSGETFSFIPEEYRTLLSEKLFDYLPEVQNGLKEVTPETVRNAVLAAAGLSSDLTEEGKANLRTSDIVSNIKAFVNPSINGKVSYRGSVYETEESAKKQKDLDYTEYAEQNKIEESSYYDYGERGWLAGVEDKALARQRAIDKEKAVEDNLNAFVEGSYKKGYEWYGQLRSQEEVSSMFDAFKASDSHAVTQPEIYSYTNAAGQTTTSADIKEVDEARKADYRTAAIAAASEAGEFTRLLDEYGSDVLSGVMEWYEAQSPSNNYDGFAAAHRLGRSNGFMYGGKLYSSPQKAEQAQMDDFWAQVGGEQEYYEIDGKRYTSKAKAIEGARDYLQRQWEETHQIGEAQSVVTYNSNEYESVEAAEEQRRKDFYEAEENAIAAATEEELEALDVLHAGTNTGLNAWTSDSKNAYALRADAMRRSIESAGVTDMASLREFLQGEGAADWKYLTENNGEFARLIDSIQYDAEGNVINPEVYSQIIDFLQANGRDLGAPVRTPTQKAQSAQGMFEHLVGAEQGYLSIEEARAAAQKQYKDEYQAYEDEIAAEVETRLGRVTGKVTDEYRAKVEAQVREEKGPYAGQTANQIAAGYRVYTDEEKTYLKEAVGEQMYDRLIKGDASTEEIAYARQMLGNRVVGLTSFTASQQLSGIKDLRQQIAAGRKIGEGEGDYQTAIASQYLSGWSGAGEYLALLAAQGTEQFDKLGGQKRLSELTQSLDNFQQSAQIKVDIEGVQQLEEAGKVAEGTAAKLEKLQKDGHVAIEVQMQMRAEAFSSGQQRAKLFNGTATEQDEAAMALLNMSREEYYGGEGRQTHLAQAQNYDRNTAQGFDADTWAALYAGTKGKQRQAVLDAAHAAGFYESREQGEFEYRGTDISNVGSLIGTQRNYTDAELAAARTRIINGSLTAETDKNLYAAAVGGLGTYGYQVQYNRENDIESSNKLLRLARYEAEQAEKEAREAEALETEKLNAQTTGGALSYSNARYQQGNKAGLAANEIYRGLTSGNIETVEDLSKAVNSQDVDNWKNLLESSDEVRKAFEEVGAKAAKDGTIDFSGLKAAGYDAASALDVLTQAVAGASEAYNNQKQILSVGENQERALDYLAGKGNEEQGFEAYSEYVGNDRLAQIVRANRQANEEYYQYNNLSAKERHAQRKYAETNGLDYVVPEYRDLYEGLDEFEKGYAKQLESHYGRITEAERYQGALDIANRIQNGETLEEIKSTGKIGAVNDYLSGIDESLFDDIAKGGDVAAKAIQKLNEQLAERKAADVSKYSKGIDGLSDIIAGLAKGGNDAVKAQIKLDASMKNLQNKQTALTKAAGKSGKQLKSDSKTLGFLQSIFPDYSTSVIEEMSKEQVQDLIDKAGPILQEQYSETISALADMIPEQEVDIPLDDIVHINADGSIDLSDVDNQLSATAEAILMAIAQLARDYGGIDLQEIFDKKGVTIKGLLRAAGSSSLSSKSTYNGGGGGGGGGGKSDVDKLLEDQKHRLASLQHENKMVEIQEKSYDYNNDYSGWRQNIDEQIDGQRALRDAYLVNISEMQTLLAKTKEGTDDYWKLTEAINSTTEAVAELSNAINELAKKKLDVVGQQFEELAKPGAHITNMLQQYAQRAMGEDRFADYERFTLQQIDEKRAERMMSAGNVETLKQELQDAINKGDIKRYDENGNETDAWIEYRDRIWAEEEKGATADTEISQMQRDLEQQRLSQIAKTVQYNTQNLQHNKNISSSYAGMYEAGGYRDQYEQMLQDQININNAMIAENVAGKAAVQERLDSGEIEEGTSAWFEAQEALNSYDETIQQLTIDNVGLGKSIIESDIAGINEQWEETAGAVSKVNDLLEAQAQTYQKAGDYKAYIEALSKEYDNLGTIVENDKNALAQLIAIRDAGLAAGNLSPEDERMLNNEIAQAQARLQQNTNKQEDVDAERRKARRDQDTEWYEDIRREPEHILSMLDTQSSRYLKDKDYEAFSKASEMQLGLINGNEYTEGTIKVANDMLAKLRTQLEEAKTDTEQDEILKNINDVETYLLSQQNKGEDIARAQTTAEINRSAEGFSDQRRETSHVGSMLKSKMSEYLANRDYEAYEAATKMYLETLQGNEQKGIVGSIATDEAELARKRELYSQTSDITEQRRLLDDINNLESKIQSQNSEIESIKKQQASAENNRISDRQAWEATNYEHNKQMLNYDVSKFQNYGELTNVQFGLEETNRRSRERITTLQGELKEWEERKKYVEAGSNEEKKITQEIIKRREEIKKEETEIENNNKALEETEQKLISIRKVLEDQIDRTIEENKKHEREMLSASVETQDTILEVLRDRYRYEQELRRKDLEKEKDALNEHKKLIDERFNYRKKAAQDADKEEDLAEMRRQLAIIEADPTRSKDAKELRKKIADEEKEQAWDIAEDEVKAEEERIDEKIEGLDKFIQYNEETTEEYLKNANNFSEEVKKIYEGTYEDLEDFMYKMNESFINSLPDAQKQFLQNWNDTWKVAKDIRDSNYAEVAKVLDIYDENGNVKSYEELSTGDYQKRYLDWNKANNLDYQYYVENGNTTAARGMEIEWENQYRDFLRSIKDDAVFDEERYDLGDVTSKVGELNDEVYKINEVLPDVNSKVADLNDYLYQLIDESKTFPSRVAELFDSKYNPLKTSASKTSDLNPDYSEGDARYKDLSKGEQLELKTLDDINTDVQQIAAAVADESEPSANSSGGANESTNPPAEEPKYTGVWIGQNDSGKTKQYKTEQEAMEAALSDTRRAHGAVSYPIVVDSEEEASRIISKKVTDEASYIDTALTNLKNTVKSIFGFSEGGLVDYTGIAAVHGSRARPESFLDSTDTALLRSMLDAYSRISYIPSMPNINPSMFGNSSTVGDINITINQAELKSDEDVGKLAKKIGQAFTKELQHNGLNLSGYSFN